MLPSIPCVLHLAHVSRSIRHRWYRERLGSRSMFDWWRERVCAMEAAGPLFVICPGEDERAELGAAWPGGEVQLVDGGHGELRSLADLARVIQEPVWALLPAGFALAPRDLLRRAYEHHQAARNTFTWAAGMPQGAAPSLFQRELLLAMDACDLPGLPTSAAAAAARLLQLARNLGAESPIPIRGVPFVPRAVDGAWPRTVMLDVPGAADTLRRVYMRMEADPDHGFEHWKEERSREKAAQLEEPAPRIESAGPPSPSGPARVLYVSNPSAFSGAEQSLCQMLDHLDPRRIEKVALVALDGHFADRLRQSGATVFVRGSDFGRMSVENVLDALRLLRRVSPDVVHFNAGDGLSVLAAARSLDIPVVLHVRNGFMSQYEDFVEVADAVVTISDFLTREVLSFDITPDRVHRIYNEIDPDHFHVRHCDGRAIRRELGIPDDAKVALMIARVAPNKRHDLFLEAAARVRTVVPSLRLALRAEVYSPADADAFAAMGDHAARLGLADAITWLPFTADVRTLHAMADVLVLCSEREGLGRCVVEAMAMELPVVVTDSGGTHELVGDDERGYVARAGDVDGLARKMAQALTADPREKTARARCFVEAELDARVSARRMMGVYETLLASRRSLKNPPAAVLANAGTMD